MIDSILESDIAEIAEGIGKDAGHFSGKTVLLCGGGGFLGRYFTQAFDYLNKHKLSKPCKLIVVDNFITVKNKNFKNFKSSGAQFIYHDIIKPLPIKTKLHFIIQAASIASPYYYRVYPLETLEVTTLGTKNMLELAQKHQARLLFFSSSEIYGDPDPDHVPTAESYRGNVACQGPRACYDEGKRLGETFCYTFHQKYGTKVNIVRPFNIYGPGMREKDYRVLPNFANSVKGNRAIKVYGSGDQTRTFCYATDALTGFLKILALAPSGETYNIGNPKPEISMVDLVKVIEKALGRRLKHKLVEYPQSYPSDEPQRRCPDITKAKLQLGFRPQVTLEEGLRRFFKWTDKFYTGDKCV